MEERFLDINRRRWNELVPVHMRSEYYDVEGFKSGQTSLHALEREEVGDVTGKTLLHLQCHFGLDTLSWARLGAEVTGVDYSEPAIHAARLLADECAIDATFIHSDIYSLPDQLAGQFDVVYTSYGVLSWLPDLGRWARVVADFLRPGGLFYIAEFHPISGIFLNGPDVSDIAVVNPYFHTTLPLPYSNDGSYADPDAALRHKMTFSWPHPLSEVINALIDAGLRIEFLHEFPYTIEKWFAFMERGQDGFYRLTNRDQSIPLLYSIRATI